jgi:hypothetical protein
MNAEPKLAPPGAGLPKIELFVARIRFAMVAGDFESRGDQCEVSTRTRKHRPPGKNHSTRNRHHREWLIPRPARVGRQQPLLVGVDDVGAFANRWHYGITRTMEALAAGIVLRGGASTAAVKPGPD